MSSESTTASEASVERWLDRWDLPHGVWVSVGAAVGLLDFSVVWLLDAKLEIAGRDATLVFLVAFIVPYAILGSLVGGLAKARSKARQDHATIARQMRELERTQRHLVQQEKLAGIGRLAAGVAHEVRNPLGVIRASASMAQESFDPGSDPYRALDFVCEETDRLDRLIQSLLTFAKPQPVECRPMELAKVVDRALELARPRAQEAGVQLETALAPDLPSLHVDPDRLSQALCGLVLNAVEAIAESGSDARSELPDRAEHDFVCIAAERAGDHARIEVRDTGPGVPSDLRDEIFEPFVTSKDRGTGLGLPMALRMVEAQGGGLALASAPGEPGACFRIELPLACRAAPDRT